MKKVLLFILSTVLILLLVGCSDSNNNSLGNVEPTVVKEQFKAERTTEAPTEAPTEVEPIIEHTYSIEEVLSDFSDDKAWVSYYKTNEDNKSLAYALIDNKGFIIWSVDKDNLSDWSECAGLTTVDDTFCLFPNNSKAFRYSAGMIIIDSLGNIQFDSRNAEEGVSYYYLGYGDGSYLAVKHVENFSENEFYFTELDKSGKTVSEISWPENWKGRGTVDTLYHINQNFNYCGNDIFIGSQDTGYTVGGGKIWYYDKKNKSFYSSEEKFSTQLGIVEMMSDNETLCQFNEGKLGTGSFDKTDKYFLIDTQTFYDAEETIDLENLEMDLYGGCYGEQLFNCIKNNESKSFSAGVYDYKGNLIESYPNNWDIKDGDSFSGGFASLQLKGADNNPYVIAVDSEGKPQYDPIKVDSVKYPSWHGYISVTIDEEDTIINPKGEKTDRSELDKQFDSYSLGNIKVVNGFEKNYNKKKELYDSFTSVNGNSLNTIYQISNYKEIAKQSISAPVVESTESAETVAPKEYVLKDNFSITGKWKNIGKYTFGQVQEGSIVSFDGTNCNFFSPKDTYAFYKDGDNFKLDCTSPLADTVSFTVKIIDENNIDVFNGSNIIELKRVN